MNGAQVLKTGGLVYRLQWKCFANYTIHVLDIACHSSFAEEFAFQSGDFFSDIFLEQIQISFIDLFRYLSILSASENIRAIQGARRRDLLLRKKKFLVIAKSFTNSNKKIGVTIK